MTSTRRPRKLNSGSVAERMAEFFEFNPAEELSVEDVAEKFGVPRHSVYAAVRHLVARGEVECVRVVRLAAKGRT